MLNTARAGDAPPLPPSLPSDMIHYRAAVCRLGRWKDAPPSNKCRRIQSDFFSVTFNEPLLKRSLSAEVTRRPFHQRQISVWVAPFAERHTCLSWIMSTAIPVREALNCLELSHACWWSMLESRGDSGVVLIQERETRGVEGYRVYLPDCALSRSSEKQ